MSISNKLSPQSNLLRFAKNAEDQIAVLRSKGLASEADQFEQILQRKVADKDPSIMDTFGQLDQIYSANLKTSKGAAEKGKVEELPTDLAGSIEDLAKKSQARNIALNPESLRDYADAALTGDSETLARLYKEFAADYKGALDIQQKEKKTLQRLGDGAQVLVGEQSGTRYSPAGLPLSVGDINTRVVNEKLAEVIPGPMQAPISGDVGVPYQPNVYEQPIIEVKERSSFRPATPEEEARFGPGQVDVASGRFYPIQPPRGMTVRSTPEGGFELVEGAGVGAPDVSSKAARAEQERSKQGSERTRVITQTASDVLSQIGSLRTSGVGARLDEAMAFLLPAETQGQIAADLETIRVQNSKEEVGKMRAASETGSAGGTITEREWPKFENRFGKLEMGMNPNQIEKNLKLTVLNQFEAVHGEPQDVIRLFEGKDLKPGERKITQDEFNRYVENYLETRQIVGIPISGVAGDKIGWTKFNQDLKKYYTGQSLIETSEQRQIVDPTVDYFRSKFGLPPR